VGLNPPSEALRQGSAGLVSLWEGLYPSYPSSIVADSNPEYEQRECEAKAGALIAAAREAVRVAGEADYGQ
jgi:hypothetical protein